MHKETAVMRGYLHVWAKAHSFSSEQFIAPSATNMQVKESQQTPCPGLWGRGIDEQWGKWQGKWARERREGGVYALDSQVGSQTTYQRVRMGEWDWVSDCEEWCVVSAYSLPALHIRASTTRCPIAAPVLHTSTIRKSIGHPTAVTVFSWVNQVVSTKVVSCHKARTIIIWVWKH